MKKIFPTLNIIYFSYINGVVGNQQNIFPLVMWRSSINCKELEKLKKIKPHGEPLYMRLQHHLNVGLKTEDKRYEHTVIKLCHANITLLLWPVIVTVYAPSTNHIIVSVVSPPLPPAQSPMVLVFTVCIVFSERLLELLELVNTGSTCFGE